MTQPIVCSPRMLPADRWLAAAERAAEINPANHAPVDRLALVMSSLAPSPDLIAVLTTKYWQAGGVDLTVGFFGAPSNALRGRILEHMNAWGKTANVRFRQSSSKPKVRIAFVGGRDGGYWSYVGTDVLSIPANEPTMNLEGFSMSTPESEFHRVVRHETGHTMGFPHEHMRRELVDLIDRQKAIAFFRQTQGWSEEMVKRQVLTPIEESSLRGTAHADPRSIMCYQIPGTITKNGQPILGGLDIDASDYAFAAKIYPKKAKVPAVARKSAKKSGAKRRVSARRRPAAKGRSTTRRTPARRPAAAKRARSSARRR